MSELAEVAEATGLDAIILPDHWRERTGTWDRAIYDAVVVNNEYELLEQYGADDVCMDIGAHIGCFSWLAHERGFGHVFAYEANEANFDLLNHNVGSLDGVDAYRCAVWRSDRETPVSLLSYNDFFNTGAHTCVGNRDNKYVDEVGRTIPATFEDVTAFRRSFDDRVEAALWSAKASSIRLVKLDCEGAEFPILYTSTMLNKIDEIVGELHEHDDVTDPSLADLPPFAAGTLGRFLRRQGFEFSYKETDSTLGLGAFRATRRL